MRQMIVALSAVCLVLFAVAAALAQAPTAPPRVLEIFREEVKYGKGAAHGKHETGYVQAFKRAKWPAHYLAIVSATGPAEAWFLSPYDSFEAWQKNAEAIEKNAALSAELDQLSEKDAEYVSTGRDIVATYREDLSYRREGVNMAQMRSFTVTMVRVRPGHVQEWEEARKIVNAAHEKANLDEHWSVYQVISGAPTGTFLIFLPHKSAKEMDDAPKIHGQSYQDALGDDGRRKLRELTSSAVLNSESNLFNFASKMSYPPDEWVKADPGFWAPKAKAAAKPAAAEMKEGGAAAAPAKKPAKKAPTKE